MRIQLSKFGSMLMSRDSGREAWAAMQPTLQPLGDAEAVDVDFAGVLVFSPSWGDEFLSPLLERFGERITLHDTENLSVQESLKLLEQIHGRAFAVAKK